MKMSLKLYSQMYARKEHVPAHVPLQKSCAAISG